MRVHLWLKRIWLLISRDVIGLPNRLGVTDLSAVQIETSKGGTNTDFAIELKDERGNVEFRLDNTKYDGVKTDILPLCFDIGLCYQTVNQWEDISETRNNPVCS